jgi:hypothetical protein
MQAAQLESNWFECLTLCARKAIDIEEPHCPGTPRHLHPIFFGCYDWHSAVHSHWLLAHTYLNYSSTTSSELLLDIEELLVSRITYENVSTENNSIATYDHDWETPYGTSWFLKFVVTMHKLSLKKDAFVPAFEGLNQLVTSMSSLSLVEVLSFPFPLKYKAFCIPPEVVSC